MNRALLLLPLLAIACSTNASTVGVGQFNAPTGLAATGAGDREPVRCLRRRALPNLVKRTRLAVWLDLEGVELAGARQLERYQRAARIALTAGFPGVDKYRIATAAT